MKGSPSARLGPGQPSFRSNNIVQSIILNTIIFTKNLNRVQSIQNDIKLVLTENKGFYNYKLIN